MAAVSARRVFSCREMGWALNFSLNRRISAGEKPFSGPMKKVTVLSKGGFNGVRVEKSPKKREPGGGCHSFRGGFKIIFGR